MISLNRNLTPSDAVNYVGYKNSFSSAIEAIRFIQHLIKYQNLVFSGNAQCMMRILNLLFGIVGIEQVFDVSV